jgi:RNA-directed DNA polymerase
MQRVRDRVKAIIAPRHRLPEPIGPIVDEVNQVLRGWGVYFRVGNSTRKLRDDHYVRERLARFLARKAGCGGHQRRRYTWAFFDKLGVYQLEGTVKWYTAAPTAVR